jgi:hypothetical protein
MKKLILAGLMATSLHAFAGQFFVVIPFPGKTSVADPTINVALTGYALPDALVGQAYAGFDFRSLLSVTGDSSYTSSGVRWRVVSGSLPAGLKLNADGTLSGSPTASGTSTFQLMASYKSKAGEQAYQIVVANITVSLAAASPPQAIVGQTYGYDLKPLLSVTGDSAYPGNASSVTWTMVSSTLPAGLYLTSDGWIGGTPTASGTGSLTVRATYKSVNGQQTYQVLTLAINVALAAGTPPQGIVGQAYTYDVKPLLTVTGDPAYEGPEQVTWSVVSGSLPAGLSLTPAGVISGTPTATANATVVVRAAYRGVNGQQTYQVVTLTVAVGLAPGTLPQGIVGQAYSYDVKPLLMVTGDAAYTGPGQVTWSVVSGSFPAGLSLASSGVISGTPTAAANGPITLQAGYRGVNGQQTYQVVTLAINVGLAAGTPPVSIVGKTYGYDLKPLLSVTGDSGYAGSGAGVTWTMLSSTLPAGLYLTSDGRIGGTPTASGTGSLTARAAYRGVSSQRAYQVSSAAQSATTSTTLLSFPNTPTGSNSTAQAMTLTNNGVVPLDLSAPVVNGEFSATYDCPASLAAGASCSVNVVFLPRTGSSETGILTIPTGAGNKAISLSGYGLTYQYIPSGYWQSVPVTTQQECDWVFVTAGNAAACTTALYDCHGTLLTAPVTGAGTMCLTGVEYLPEYETVTTYQQQWVDTSYYAWE